MGYIKYRCKSCGRVEYYTERGARNWPASYIRSCKKSRDGFHVWEQLGVVDKLPANRQK